jgi:2-dehydropantoate 2-reductase
LVRFVVVGAGAVGGIIGASLYDAGHDAILVARSAHGRQMDTNGVRIERPTTARLVKVPRTEGVVSLRWTTPSVVILAVQSQDTDAALESIAMVAPRETPVVCAQNGVENERRVLRRFPNVYGMVVLCPVDHREPGVIVVHGEATTGVLDLGRYPGGSGQHGEEISQALRDARFDSLVTDDIMRWKYAKLVYNLVNAVRAICAPGHGIGELEQLVREEGRACLAAAGIACAPLEELLERVVSWRDSASHGTTIRHEDSTSQRLARKRSIESDYLNGEIVLLGRTYRIPTPANDLVLRLVHDAARSGCGPHEHLADELLATLR